MADSGASVAPADPPQASSEGEHGAHSTSATADANPVADGESTTISAQLARLEGIVAKLVGPLASLAESRPRETPAQTAGFPDDVTRNPSLDTATTPQHSSAAQPRDVAISPDGLRNPRDLPQMTSGFRQPQQEGLPRIPSGQQWNTNAPCRDAAPLQSFPGPSGLLGAPSGRPGAVAADSLPRIERVSPQMRQDILTGKDINLAALLIPGYRGPGEFEQRSLIVGQEVHTLKPLTDHRVNKCLTITEFIQAFTIYKNVMCEAFPMREKELSAYMADIVDMASRFPGLTFYEYHKEFSAQSAAWQAQGVAIDWSKRDTKLFCSLFAGHKANSCAICNSLGHATSFCPMSSNPGNKPVRQGPGEKSQRSMTQRVLVNGKEICFNFNASKGCYQGNNCKRLHACLNCQGPHAKINCSKQFPASTELAKLPSTHK